MQLSEISEWHVVRYAKAQKESRVNKVSALRMLFKYWKSMGAIGYDLEETFAVQPLKDMRGLHRSTQRKKSGK